MNKRLEIKKEIEFNKEIFVEFFDTIIQNIKNEGMFNLNGSSEVALTFFYEALVSGFNEEAFTALGFASEFKTASLNSMSASTETISFRLLDHDLRVKTGKPDHNFNSYEWNTAFDLALILKDKEKLNLLHEIECWKVKGRQPFHRSYAHLRHLIHTGQIKNINKQFDEISEIANSDLTAFIGLDGNKPKILKGLSNEILLLRYPLVQLYKLIIDGNEDGFNRLLSVFIENKKAWIKKNEEQNNSSYWADLPLLGICSFAIENNININYESEYIPKWLYIKDFETKQDLK